MFFFSMPAKLCRIEGLENRAVTEMEAEWHQEGGAAQFQGSGYKFCGQTHHFAVVYVYKRNNGFPLVGMRNPDNKCFKGLVLNEMRLFVNLKHLENQFY